MTSDAQKAAAKTIADNIVALATGIHMNDDTFAADMAVIAMDIPDRVARRVLDNYQTALNPLLGPHGLRVASGRRISRTRR